MIDKATAEKIKEVADIVEVVGDYVHLTRRGANFMGLCPFHNERTPSFSVNRARNFCYCFSCHKGGSPVNFIMEKEGIGYQDALRQLARKYGIKIEERELTDEERRARGRRESMFMANEWAMQKFRGWLTESDEGRRVGLSYLYGRGVTEESVRVFRLGYSPDANVLEREARRDGYNPEVLAELGLLGRGQQGGFYDRFRGRVIFPVLNASGRVVAFGGRDLKGAKAKYINSPESAIYRKSNELYGLYQARGEMSRSEECFLVEGYLDVIGMAQAGIGNVVASSGTALTEQQTALIHRFAKGVTLIYDGDSAGIKATMRGIDILLAQGLDVKTLLLPDGHDPDSFARTRGGEEMRRYMEANATDFITYKARVLMREGDDPATRTAAARALVESLGAISDKIKRNVYIRETSRLLGVDEQVLSYEADARSRQYATERRRRREMERLRADERREASASSGESAENGGEGESASATSTASGAPAATEEEAKDGGAATAATGRTSPAQTPPARRSPAGDVPSSGVLGRLEKLLLRLCVRYGMVAFCDAPEPDAAPWSVLDYVQAELEADGIEFTDGGCARLYAEMLESRGAFAESLGAELARLDAEADARFREECARLLDSSVSVDEINDREAAVSEEIERWRRGAEFEFAEGWLSRRLVSHEDDTVRRLASQMVAEPYQLSKYHARKGVVASEADRLGEFVPRALNELRAGIVDSRIAAVNAAIAGADPADADTLTRLLAELNELHNTRKAFAFHNGERILARRQTR